MRVALLSGEYPPDPGGVGDYTRQLGLALLARGHSVAVLTIQAGQGLRYDLSAPGAPALFWPPAAASPLVRSLDWSPRCWPALSSALERWPVDWLHIQYQTGAYAMRPGVNLLPWWLRRLAARPRVAVTFHDLLEPYLLPKAAPLRRWVNRRLARDADAVVATNAADAAGLQALGVRATIIPIGSNIPLAPPPGYDRAAWRAGLGLGADELLVAYFGLLSASKGVDLLIEALAGLERPWRLLVIGGAATAPQDVAYAAATRATVERLGLAGQIISTGHVDEPGVSAHLLAADLVGLPFRDGASLRRGSLLAALAHGCPLITSAPGDPETAALLRDGEHALLTPRADVRALRAAVLRLADAPELRAQLADAGKTLAARFSWERIAMQHEKLYGKV